MKRIDAILALLTDPERNYVRSALVRAYMAKDKPGTVAMRTRAEGLADGTVRVEEFLPKVKKTGKHTVSFRPESRFYFDSDGSDYTEGPTPYFADARTRESARDIYLCRQVEETVNTIYDVAGVVRVMIRATRQAVADRRHAQWKERNADRIARNLANMP